MTEISSNNFEMSNTFSELDKFPQCCKPNCLLHLEIQDRFKCNKCSQIFCGDHRIDFKHNCPNLDRVNLCKPVSKIYERCSEATCNNKLVYVKFHCSSCDKLFCASHRLNFEHKCIK